MKVNHELRRIMTSTGDELREVRISITETGNRLVALQNRERELMALMDEALGIQKKETVKDKSK